MTSARSAKVEAGRKARGAYFTSPEIANYLAAWAVDDDGSARILDPTCGEAVFLRAAGRQLKNLGCRRSALRRQVFGVDLHGSSLSASLRVLNSEGLDARLLRQDFFSVPTPRPLGCPLPEMDAVIGNPPFVRYQHHAGEARRRSARAALAQGVRLSGLASSWAALLVHACAFLKPEGRLAMVLPAELLTVHYAEPIRRWLRERFAAVHLVMFERLQFDDALEKVVLLVARGSGGCDAFSLHYVEDAEDLCELGPFDHFNVTPADEGKWTDLLLPMAQRQLFKRIVDRHFVPLATYGRPALGTVTGSNRFFALSESTRTAFELSEEHLVPISPPGTKHLKGLTFSRRDWREERDADRPVWLLQPATDDIREFESYLAHGQRLGVQHAYKCRVRTPWWKPPLVPTPDLFFTYMSHRYPRLVSNTARVGFLNSMHGIRLATHAPREARAALPLLTLNSVTMLGAEIYGRSYGGGILKMEPREAASLPVPAPKLLSAAWRSLKGERSILDQKLRAGAWSEAVDRVDEVLLRNLAGLDAIEAGAIDQALAALRSRRLGR